jgi:N-acetyl-anhydromuramyl-L-alanine amidase AmpD
VTGEFTSHTIENITVHHTAVALTTNSAAPARARQHQSYHQGLGWPDLAYHYLIDANGHVYEGRPVTAVGDTATDYDPTGHFLVCCEGDFNTQQITPAQYESLVRMLAWGSAEFGVTAGSIQGHRDVASTTCPGDNLYPLIADGTIERDVAALVVSAAPALDVVCGQVAIDIVAAIESGTI